MNNQVKESIIFGNKVIDYLVEFSTRKTLEINVYPDLSVIVKAPLNTKSELVQKKVVKRAYWIIKQKDFFSQFLSNKNKNKFISGESLFYLGRQYRIKIIQNEVEQVKLLRGILNVFIKDKQDTERIEKLLNHWYLEHAKKYFHKALLKQYEKVRKYDVELPELKVRKLKKRWGSCTKDSKIILNIELIKVSSLYIDYVIMHELCHLKYYSHNKDFYNFLSLLMPDWQKRKKKLENMDK